ncbi:glutamate carboxypeptidase [Advenella sp. S44]|uniref:M20/M25/M40 family metallo-hydrolase n=1 Tax=Advenella sp. S44 TaxID=1982755 RepID=UPI000C2B1866|nr:M20/M25/M40 family metallo-hydrolase [Advenella sp. S44]PJX20417.1 glutamate carboxypeptidase [Advenella sp. S44]
MKFRSRQSCATRWKIATGAVLALAAGAVLAAPVAAVHDLAKKEQQAYLDTLRDLVHIESGSKDIEGVNKIAQFVADRLKQLGAQTEIIQPEDVYRMDDTPEKTGPIVHGTIKGTGKSKIMLIAHMDTVYQKGDLKDQPFRVDGDKAYGLGIADDKQGVAAILHVVDMLKKLNYAQFGTLTVVLNSDEEISSPGSRALITKFAEDQDAVFSFEGGGKDGGVRLATSGIGAAYLKVHGKSSHAGARPEGGVNSLYELAHQVLQMKDLSKPEDGLKLNWTLANVGTVRNMIPPEATAQADARALKVQDFDALEKAMQEKIQNKLLPDSKVELKFEVRRPPLEASDLARKLAGHAQSIYKDELDLEMTVADKATGGGTDAAFAGVKSRGGVVEGFGLSGFGAHSNNAEYVQIPTIVPRLYLATRMIMDISEGKTKP